MSQRKKGTGTLDRRTLLKAFAAAGVAGGTGALFAAPPALSTLPSKPSPSVAENARPGTADWLLRRPRLDAPTRLRSSAIEGYASAIGVRAGERLQIFASARPAARVLLEVFRLGYYGGAGARLVLSLPEVRVGPQPVPEMGKERLRACVWSPSFELTVPADWTSGVYLGRLTAQESGADSFVVFVVRDDRPCDVLVQCSTTTWAAYNRWPEHGSLYDDGQKEWSWGPHVQVSYDRPWSKYCQLLDAPQSLGSGEVLLWEYPLLYWLEQQGYDVSYTTNEDTHTDAAGLRRGKLWISVGHDEYWTLEMYRNILAARDAGVSLAFLSGNTCFGLVELLPDAAGRPRRTVRRLGQFGGVDPRFVHDFPESGGFERRAPDEALLLGARSGYPVTGSADWICQRPEHWLFSGTGMRKGDAIGGLVGWEWHGEPAALPGLEVLASGPIRNGKSVGEYTATVYPGPRGSFVFNGATIWWSDGLSAPPGYVRPFFSRKIHLRGPDVRVQRMTANLIARAVAARAAG